MSEYNTILVEQRGAVTLVTLNRPQALNALNSEVLKELIDAFAAYDADESQRCLVLTGSGDKAFAAGADIKEFTISKTSLMPSYKDTLNSTEIADLLGYLLSLKGQ